MSNITLYTSPLCPYAQRVRLAVSEKGLQAEEIEIDPRNKPDWFLALSPAGKVPLLVHNGVRLWESAVINEYLDEAFSERPLLPQIPERRALARAWISIADWRIYEPTHRLLLCQHPREQARLAEELAAQLRFLEEHALAVHDGPYWLGEAFSLTDIAFFPWFEQVAVLERFRLFRMPRECKRISAWRGALACRPGVRSVMREPEFYVHGYGALFDQLDQGTIDRQRTDATGVNSNELGVT